MDSTLVISTNAIERMSTHRALRHDLIPLQVLSAIRGVRIADSVRALAPRCSDIDAEIARLLSEERDKVDGLVLGAGARELLECLPRDIWPVVTSTNRGLAETRMHLAGLQKRRYSLPLKTSRRENPRPMVTGSRPKNAGWIAKTVVFEDSDIGISAVQNTGCPVLPSRRPALRRSSIKSIGLKTLRRFQSNAPIETYHFVSRDPLDQCERLSISTGSTSPVA